jgi:hypothetical protein
MLLLSNDLKPEQVGSASYRECFIKECQGAPVHETHKKGTRLGRLITWLVTWDGGVPHIRQDGICHIRQEDESERIDARSCIAIINITTYIADQEYKFLTVNEPPRNPHIGNP